MRKQPGATDTVIAFIHGVGDNIMATPAIRAYKWENPQEALAVVVRGDTDAAQVWENNPYVQRIVTLAPPYPDYWHPRYFFLTHRPLVRRLTEIRDALGASRLLHLKVNTLPMLAYRVLPHPHKIVKIAQELGVRLRSTDMEVHPKERHAKLAGEFLARAGWTPGSPLVAVNRTGSAPYKFWELNEYELLVATLASEGFVVVGCYTPQTARSEEALNGRRARIRSSRYLETLDMDGHLLTSAALFTHCSAVVSTDSAPLHLAAAAGAPTVALFPATRPELYRPLDTPTVALTGQPTASAVRSALGSLL